MNKDKYVFAQLVKFLDNDKFRHIVKKYNGDKYIKSYTCWNQLLTMMFGQLSNRESLRDLIIVLNAHVGKLYHLGIGKSVTRSNLSKANENRDYHIFEEFATFMIGEAQKRRIDKIFDLKGPDSTTIHLCLSVFKWAKYKRAAGGIKMHTLYDIEAEVPVFVHITPAQVNDIKAMPMIPYEQGAHYIFDRGYNAFDNLYTINRIGAFFVVRSKTNVRFSVKTQKQNLPEGIISDEKGTFSVYKSRQEYPNELRKVVIKDQESDIQYIFLTNNLDAPPELISQLYLYRWKIELFFKWIKQHLKIKKFWGTSENAVRIQIYCAIITYCLVAVVQHDMKIERTIYEVLQILGISLTDKTHLRDLFDKSNFSNVNVLYDSSELNLFNYLDLSNF